MDADFEGRDSLKALYSQASPINTPRKKPELPVMGNPANDSVIEKSPDQSLSLIHI